MSIRRGTDSIQPQKTEKASITPEHPVTPISAYGSHPGAEFDQLTGVEQAAASLGVSPDAWKPIGFMNKQHFQTLIEQNALGDTLTRRIKAFSEIAPETPV
jgi:hypothetical protein